MTDSSRTELLGKLASEFIAAAEAASQRVKSLRIPLSVTTAQLAVVRDEANPDAWRSYERQVEQNVLLTAAPHQVAPLGDRRHSANPPTTVLLAWSA